MLKREGKQKLKKRFDEKTKIPWPYWMGGILLGGINVVMLAMSEQALKVSTGIACHIGQLASLMGHNAEEWHFFKEGTQVIVSGGTLYDNIYTFLIVGMIIGALMGANISSQWRIRKFKREHIIYALVGGILMGIGARLAGGCNIGALFSAIPSFSLHGWIFGASLFGGTYIGIKILMKYRI